MRRLAVRFAAICLLGALWSGPTAHAQAFGPHTIGVASSELTVSTPVGVTITGPCRTRTFVLVQLIRQVRSGGHFFILDSQDIPCEPTGMNVVFDAPCEAGHYAVSTRMYRSISPIQVANSLSDGFVVRGDDGSAPPDLTDSSVPNNCPTEPDRLPRQSLDYPPARPAPDYPPAEQVADEPAEGPRVDAGDLPITGSNDVRPLVVIAIVFVLAGVGARAIRRTARRAGALAEPG